MSNTKREKEIILMMTESKKESNNSMPINVAVYTEDELSFVTDWMKGKRGYKLVTPVLRENVQ